MHLFKRATLSVAIAVSLSVGLANALEFSATYSFGDSLSDSGAFAGAPDAGQGSKFTAEPGTIWVENLADYFGNQSLSNNPNNPDNTNPDGTNYAQGGAQVSSPVGIGQTPSPQAATPIAGQVDTYFNGHATADEDALYTLWGGANDIFFNLAMVAGGLPVDNALMNLAGSATELVAQADRLAAAGARYILMPNLPDIGSTPSQVLQIVAGAGAGNPALNDALIASITVLALGGSDLAQVQLDALAAAEAALGFPVGSLTPAFMQLSALSSGLSFAYNSVLLGAMNASDANIIPLDTFTMFAEVMADPGAFGLFNVTGVACATPSSLPCTADTVIDPMAPAVFMFADGVHPTAAGHKIISDYALSVIAAPALVANLPEVTLGAVRGHQQILLNKMRTKQFSDSWSLFIDVGMGRQDIAAGQAWDAEAEDLHLLFGGARKLSANWTLGAALEKTVSNVDFARDMGGFELSGLELSVFADYRRDQWFADAILTLGLQNDLNDIDRDIRLGGGHRVEQGDTSADVFALKVLAGYEWLHSDSVSAGPFVSINYQSVDVDGYVEAGQRSTAMNFAEQNRDSLLGEIGVFADYSLGHANLHVGLAWETELKDDARTVSAGLNSLADSRFDLYDIEASDSALKLDLGLSADFDNFHTGIGYTYWKGDGDNKDHLISVGFQLDL